METRDNSSPPFENEGSGTRGGGIATEAKAAVEREVHDAKDRLSSAGSALRSEASGAADTISTLVSEQAERRKEEAADGLSSFAQSIRRAADDLGASDQSMSARLVKEAAHSLEQLSGSLQSRSVNDLTRSVTTFGRDNPTAFLAGCLLAGVAVGRFLIASGTRSHGEGDDGAAEWRSDNRYARSGESDWPGDRRDPYPGAASGPAADASGGMGVSDRSGTGMSGSVSGAAGVGAGVAGADIPGAGVGSGASGRAGTFAGGTVAPSSAERAPGDLDAQGTMMEDPEPTFPSDAGLGERVGGLAGEGGADVPKPYADLGLGKGGRNGDV